MLIIMCTLVFLGLVLTQHKQLSPRAALALCVGVGMCLLLASQPELALAAANKKDIWKNGARELQESASSISGAVIFATMTLGLALSVACTVFPPLHRYAMTCWGGFLGLSLLCGLVMVLSDSVFQGVKTFWESPIGFLFGSPNPGG